MIDVARGPLGHPPRTTCFLEYNSRSCPLTVPEHPKVGESTTYQIPGYTTGSALILHHCKRCHNEHLHLYISCTPVCELPRTKFLDVDRCWGHSTHSSKNQEPRALPPEALAQACLPLFSKLPRLMWAAFLEHPEKAERLAARADRRSLHFRLLTVPRLPTITYGLCPHKIF